MKDVPLDKKKQFMRSIILKQSALVPKNVPKMNENIKKIFSFLEKPISPTSPNINMGESNEDQLIQESIPEEPQIFQEFPSDDKLEEVITSEQTSISETNQSNEYLSIPESEPIIKKEEDLQSPYPGMNINYDDDRIFCFSTHIKFIERTYTKSNKEKNPFYFIGIMLEELDINVSKIQFQQWLNTIEYLAWLNARKYNIRRSKVSAENIPKLKEEFQALLWDYLNNLDELDIKWDLELINPLHIVESQRIKELLVLLPQEDMKEVTTENILAFIKNKLKENIAKQKQKPSLLKFWNWGKKEDKDLEKEEEELEKLQDMIDKYLDEDKLEAVKNPITTNMIQVALEMKKCQIFLMIDGDDKYQQGVSVAVKDIKLEYSKYAKYENKITSELHLKHFACCACPRRRRKISTNSIPPSWSPGTAPPWWPSPTGASLGPPWTATGCARGATTSPRPAA